VNQRAKSQPMFDPEASKANKAKLSQERSRLTRRKIVKAALALWNGRGFEDGFDTTTVDEIADKAGISRATVYYYFPKKEDILRDLAWVTAEEIYESAIRSMMSKDSVEDVIEQLMLHLGHKVMKASPAAVSRMMQLRKNNAEDIDRDIGSAGLSKAFSIVLAHAQEMGDLPRSLSSLETAEILVGVVMGAISKWTALGGDDLPETLRRRAMFVLAGARHFTAD